MTPLEEVPPDEPRRDAPLEEEDFGGPVEHLEPAERLAVFDPEPGRERIRGRVAGALILLLALLTVGALGAVIAGVSSDEIRSITEIVLPPVVALCGSAIGFYFASGPGGAR